jgi:hypothetical protein
VGDLNLTPADVDEVVRMIERATHDFSPAIALRAWDSYAANGHWGSNGWPTHWPPFIRGNRPQGPSRPGNRPE